MKEVIKLAKDWEWPIKSEALEYLWMTHYSECKNIAIKALQDEDAWLTAVYILWEEWDTNDIIYLKKKALELEKYEQLWLLHINDALQKIFYRN